MISAQSLSYSYSGGPSLRFADLQAAQGSTVVLQGRSGAGKSTWLALVAGLRVPNAGSLTVAGADLAAMGAAERDQWRARKLGFLPQKLHLSTALSVQDNLELVYFAAGLPSQPDAVQRSLASLGVADLAHRRPSQLSGGQAQRVALARAVLLAPQVILADEPTASLDDEAAAASLALLTVTAARLGATLVITTHDARVQTALQGAIKCQIGGSGISDGAL